MKYLTRPTGQITWLFAATLSVLATSLLPDRVDAQRSSPRPKAAAPNAARAAVAAPAPLALHGVASPNAENAAGEVDSRVELRLVRPASLVPPRRGVAVRRLRAMPEAPAIFDAVGRALATFAFNAGLLAGNKYMVNDCLGVKASAGQILIRVQSPTLRGDANGVSLTFRIRRLELNALRVRFRPNPGNLANPCHFSSRVTIGGWAEDVSYTLRFDPILSDDCTVADLGNYHQNWNIGRLGLSPFPELGSAGKNMLEDALQYASNWNLLDRLVADLNAALSVQCVR